MVTPSGLFKIERLDYSREMSLMNCWNSHYNIYFFHRTFASNGDKTKSVRLLIALTRLLRVEIFVLWSILWYHCFCHVLILWEIWSRSEWRWRTKMKKNLKYEMFQITMEKWQYLKAFNSTTWIKVYRIQAVDSWSKEHILPQMTPLFNPWMLTMIVWMFLWISQWLRLSLQTFDWSW